MGLNFGKFRKTDYNNLFGNIGPAFYKSKVVSSTNNYPKKESIENKVKEQEIIKEPHIPVSHSIERKMQDYRW